MATVANYLTPTDSNYLTSRLIYNQLVQKSIPLTLNSANVTANISAVPTLHLDGQGRGFLTGSMTITNATPPANMPLFTMPAFLPLLNDYSLFGVTEFTGSTYQANFLELFNGSNSITSITIVTPGAYASIPAVEISAPGEGFIGVADVKAVAIGVNVAQSGSGSYAPGDVCQLVGGTVIGGDHLTFIINRTEVVAATVNTGGTGGTNGTATVTGTSGTSTPTRFTANVTIAGGAITSVNSITFAGSYNSNPTILSNEPVTGAGLSGASLSVKMGASQVTPNTAGDYSAIPATPYTTSNISSVGTGLTLAINWGINNIDVIDGGFGYTSASQVVFVGGGVIAPATTNIVFSGNPEVPTGQLANSSTVGHQISLDGIMFFTGSY